jgi:hypothetical protein
MALYLFISPDGRRRWTFMYKRNGKQREAGLGRAPERKSSESKAREAVSLKAAREKASEGRALLKVGTDPIANWNKPDARQTPTFREAADEF